MPFYSTVACNEMHATQSENADIKAGVSCQVTVRCAYTDRWALADDILLNQRIYPWSVGSTAPRAHSVKITPVSTDYDVDSGSPQIIIYKFADVTIEYGNEIKDLVAESFEPAVEFIKLDYKKFRWGSASGTPLLEGEAPGKQQILAVYTQTRYRIAAPLPAVLITAMGKCNASSYTSRLLGLVFPAETLLYTPPQTTRTITTAGTEGYTVPIRFSVNPVGWNVFWRAASQTFEKMYVHNPIGGGTGEYKNYPTGNFSTLLA